MSTQVFIPHQTSQSNPAFALQFPNRCVYTGEAAQRSEWVIASYKYGRRIMSAKVKVPYSEQAMQEAKRNRRVARVVFLLASVLLVIGVFVGAAAMRLKGGAVFGLGPFVALFLAALATGFVCKYILSKKWPTMKDMPLFYFESGNIGLRVHPQTNGVNFWFVNDAIAREFANLNRAEVKTA